LKNDIEQIGETVKSKDKTILNFQSQSKQWDEEKNSKEVKIKNLENEVFFYDFY